HPRWENNLGSTLADATGQRKHSVMRDIEYRLYQLLLVATQLRHRQVVVTPDPQALRKLGHYQAAYTLTNFVDVYLACDMRPAVRLQQTIHQHLQAVGFLDDDLRVFAQMLQIPSRQLELQQLRRPPDTAQRILDLMRQIAYQLLVGDTL